MDKVIILGIESSCDDTSASVVENRKVLSNVVASQKVHEAYGGVVPELASRAHQANIIPVVDAAIKQAGIALSDISAVAVTLGPGLLGSLLVGVSFAKSFASALGINIISVNHLQAHVLSCFIEESDSVDNISFPFLSLLASGGNSQIVLVEAVDKMKIIGQTIDDASGEAFDKCAKIMGLPYPGGPHIDRLAKLGDSNRFTFAKPNIAGYDYSFSGLKTSFLYAIRDEKKKNINFVEENLPDLCASLQKTIIDILLKKLILAAKDFDIKNITIAGGVSANSELRESIKLAGKKYKWNVFIPDNRYTTDNAAMIAVAGYFKFVTGSFSKIDEQPFARTII